MVASSASSIRRVFIKAHRIVTPTVLLNRQPSGSGPGANEENSVRLQIGDVSVVMLVDAANIQAISGSWPVLGARSQSVPRAAAS